MPKTYTGSKPVKSFRLSEEGIHQLRSMAEIMGRSESDVLEVALDRMYREEIRYNHVLRERAAGSGIYTTSMKEDGNENHRDDIQMDREDH
jgi:hypothetical protein